ncbi:MAG: hypothetical protein MZV70_64090 [Desulfobacterales bacterium]|nr:hypothetical protein [Desulfobacterales bacterium]
MREDSRKMKPEYKTGWQLITPDEEDVIFDHWQRDKEIHNISDESMP